MDDSHYVGAQALRRYPLDVIEVALAKGLSELAGQPMTVTISGLEIEDADVHLAITARVAEPAEAH